MNEFKKLIENFSFDRLFNIEGKDTGCLGYMCIGMLGVFMIVGIIMGATYAIGHLTAKLEKKEDNE